MIPLVLKVQNTTVIVFVLYLFMLFGLYFYIRCYLYLSVLSTLYYIVYSILCTTEYITSTCLSDCKEDSTCTLMCHKGMDRKSCERPLKRFQKHGTSQRASCTFSMEEAHLVPYMWPHEEHRAVPDPAMAPGQCQSPPPLAVSIVTLCSAMLLTWGNSTQKHATFCIGVLYLPNKFKYTQTVTDNQTPYCIGQWTLIAGVLLSCNSWMATVIVP